MQARYVCSLLLPSSILPCMYVSGTVIHGQLTPYDPGCPEKLTYMCRLPLLASIYYLLCISLSEMRMNSALKCHNIRHVVNIYNLTN